jgi:hypothetical protein
VAVIAHAQHQHINRRQFGQQAVGLLGSVFKVGGGAVEAEELRLGRRALQQVRFSRPALLSACSTGTQRSSARLTVTFDQSRPAWPGAGKTTGLRPPDTTSVACPGTDGRAQSFGHVNGQAFGQQAGVRNSWAVTP